MIRIQLYAVVQGVQLTIGRQRFNMERRWRQATVPLRKDGRLETPMARQGLSQLDIHLIDLNV